MRYYVTIHYGAAARNHVITAIRAARLATANVDNLAGRCRQVIELRSALTTNPSSMIDWLIGRKEQLLCGPFVLAYTGAATHKQSRQNVKFCGFQVAQLTNTLLHVKPTKL